MTGVFSHYMTNPRGVCFKGQAFDEKIILLLRRHIVTNVPWVVTTILFLYIPYIVPKILTAGGFVLPVTIPLAYQMALWFLWYLVVLAYAFESYLIWYFNVYVVTNRRVVDVDFYGFLSMEISDASLESVQDTTYNISGVFATAFNFGHVFIQTAAESSEFDFEFVPHPADVQKVISDLITKKMQHKP